MNKLVIVGNGFDLAHALPTSYKDFINDFWCSLKNNLQKEETNNFIDFNSTYLNNMSLFEVKSYADFKSILKDYCTSSGYDYNEKRVYCRNKPHNGFSVVFQFKNSFFKEINEQNTITNWVDIENIYYQELTDLVKKNVESKFIEKLNVEFEQVKNLFENYLETNIVQEFDFSCQSENLNDLLKFFIVEPLYLEREKSRSKYLKEFPFEDHSELIELDEKIIEAYRKNQLASFVYSNDFPENVFLNFNYTPTIDCYLKKLNNRDVFNCVNNSREIQIHGAVNCKENEMNFGFGDEMDNNYTLIEELNNNIYLKNFKSFKSCKIQIIRTY
ncbi:MULTISPECIES: AbiH family protein [Maribacter]|uniref:AbiH family protein n=1 Tax=Maribacter flavus TaxID=1658664 RepID=A0ABU7IE74_9FLAO|nr:MULTISPECIES: AbiH family protein [Maribacter]MDC6404101.1 AbiH family protein [Maribacter sp. PR66]MEE1971242.1 AbiH family protein [Maribacter flavus]